jgi:hypothetical protein
MPSGAVPVGVATPPIPRHVHPPPPSDAKAFLQQEEREDNVRAFPYSVALPSQHAILGWGELAAEDPGCTPPPLLTTMAALLRRPAVDAVHEAQLEWAQHGQRLSLLAPVDAYCADRVVHAVDREAIAAGCASALLARSLKVCVVPSPIDVSLYGASPIRLVDVLVATADVEALLEVARYPFLLHRNKPARYQPGYYNHEAETTCFRTLICTPPHPTAVLGDAALRVAVACRLIQTALGDVEQQPNVDHGTHQVRSATDDCELRAVTRCLRTAVGDRFERESFAEVLKKLFGSGQHNSVLVPNPASDAVTPRRVALVQWWGAFPEEPSGCAEMAEYTLAHYRAVLEAHTLRIPTDPDQTRLYADVVALLGGEVLGPLRGALRHRCDTIATSWASLPAAGTAGTAAAQGSQPLSMRGEARLHLYTTPIGGMGADPRAYSRLLARLWTRCADSADPRLACLAAIAALVRNGAADVALAFAVVAEGRGLAVFGAAEDFTYPKLWRRNRQHDLQCQLACHAVMNYFTASATLTSARTALLPCDPVLFRRVGAAADLEKLDKATAALRPIIVDDVPSGSEPLPHVLLVAEAAAAAPRKGVQAGDAVFAAPAAVMQRWQELTCGIFEPVAVGAQQCDPSAGPLVRTFPWHCVVAAGGAVVHCVSAVPPAQRPKDVDLFLYGAAGNVNPGARVAQIERHFRRVVGPGNYATLLTSKVVTFLFADPKIPRVQVVLGAWESVTDILTTMDVDSSAVAFDGRQAVMSARAAGAWATGLNVASHLSHNVRGSPHYELRLYKYAARNGFAVLSPLKAANGAAVMAAVDEVAKVGTGAAARRSAATSLAGLKWLVGVEQGVVQPRYEGQQTVGRRRATLLDLEVSETNSLADILKAVEGKGYSPSDDYGQTEEGFVVAEDNGEPLAEDLLEPAEDDTHWTVAGADSTYLYDQSVSRAEMASLIGRYDGDTTPFSNNDDLSLWCCELQSTPRTAN